LNDILVISKIPKSKFPKKLAITKIYFKNKKGNKLCGVLVSPDNKNHPIVILCHGFHSTKDNNTNTRLKELLKDKSIATFRFDFFGHGESEGKFEDITVSQAVEDLLSAIDLLKKKGYKKNWPYRC
jgi:alpha/beta superfamily hydrolase